MSKGREMKKLILLAAMVFPVNSMAGGIVTGVAFNKPSQGADFTHDIEIGNLERFSIQLDYAEASPSTSTISDGEFSSMTVTVGNWAALQGVASTATLTLTDGSNTSGIDDAVISVNGRKYTEGIDWDRGATSTATMASLSTALDAYWEYQSFVSSNIITLTAYSSGTAANSWTINSSTNPGISTGTWSGGQAYGYISINGTTLTEGTDFTVATSSNITANAIEEAINSNSTLSAVVTATNSVIGKFNIVSDQTGINPYPVSVSDAANLSMSAVYLAAGSASDINISSDSFSENAHGFGTGLPVLFNNLSGTDPTGLSDQTTYYIILNELHILAFHHLPDYTETSAVCTILFNKLHRIYSCA